LEEGLKFEAGAFAVTAATEDRKEGTAAFLEKRKAVFQGK
jgi:enoyl-CoA hydratase